MNEFYILLQKIEENQIHFVFQSHHKSIYFNLMVKDTYGKEHNFHSYCLSEIKDKLKIIWGHLLLTKKPAGMPKPPGIPMPR